MTRQRAIGLSVSAAAAAAWVAFGLANGPATGNDTRAYLRVTDALAAGEVVTSARTPGYPLFLLACRALAGLLAVDPGVLTLVVQTVLLAGVATWLVFGLGVRLTARTSAGAVAAVLFALDPDVQQFGTTLLTEAPTVVLALAAVSLRLRDDHWWRAGWLLAALALVRPNFVVFPLLFAALDGIRLRRPGAAIAAAGPTALVLGAWSAVALAAGADPLRPQRWFVPTHAFGTIYQADLWRKLPDGPERRVVADARQRGLDPYQAAAALRAAQGEDAVVAVTRAAVRADPMGYAAAVTRALRDTFRQPSWMRREIVQPAHPHPALLAAVSAWHGFFRRKLYASFTLFVLLLAGACWRGLGWPRATEAFRHVIGPFVVTLLVTTALSALSNYDVGRIALSFRPFYCLTWGLAAAWALERVRPTRRSASPSP